MENNSVEKWLWTKARLIRCFVSLAEASSPEKMKLEYLADASPPLIRLYEFNQAEVRQLRELVSSLVAGTRQSVALQSEAWAKSIDGCCLNLRLGNRDRGILPVSDLNFECTLTSDGWSNVEGLLDPFCESEIAGYQWLTHDGRVPLLISQHGQW